MEIDDRAISLKEASKILGVSYGSIWRNREKLAFRLPQTRTWRIWMSTLANLKPKSDNKGGFLESVGEDDGMERMICQYSNPKTQRAGGLISTLAAENELNDLLKQRTKRKLKNTMIG